MIRRKKQPNPHTPELLALARVIADTLNTAGQLNPPPGLIHHSDRGVQYACADYVERLEGRAIAVSMSRPANPYDNAKAESFMKTLKTEEVNGKAYRDLEDAEAQIGAFIENVYNATRLHSALGYKPPVEFEDALTRDQRKPTNQEKALSLN